jgi:hypothetical protein
LRLRALVVIAALLAPTLAPRAARADDPDTEQLLIAGLGMAIPTYFLGVTLHEGSHALAAKSVGAEITRFTVVPGRREGHFSFGYTRWRGDLSRGEKAFVYLAPRITDTVLLGLYGLMIGLDTLPDDEYGALALTVLATGTWIDFTKDVFATSGGNDLVKFHLLYDRASEWQRLPYRLLHVALSVGAAYCIVQGYTQIFDDPGQASPAFVVPIVAGAL